MTTKMDDLDNTLASVKATQDTTRALAAQIDANRKSMQEMQEQYGVKEDTIQKFKNSLGPEGQALVAAEEERFQTELRQDMEEALHRASVGMEKQVKKPKARQYL